MKKNSGGYVIIYVVFVILFLCIVAVGTSTYALNNLRTQTSYIEQMQDRYAAEGAIEKFMAEVCVAGTGLKNAPPPSEKYTTPQDAIIAAKAAFAEKIVSNDDVSCIGDPDWVDGGNECKITLETVCGSTKITAEAAFCATINTPSYTVTEKHSVIENGEQVEKDVTVTYYNYEIARVTSKYLSYILESVGGDAA